MKKRFFSLGVLVGCLLVGTLSVFGFLVAGQHRALEAKAAKFSAYCREVRAQLESFAITLEPPTAGTELPHVTQFRHRSITAFYTKALFQDRDAVGRCAPAATAPDIVNKLKARCEPPASCVRDPYGARCQIDPVCVRGVVAELIAMLPETLL